MAVRRRGRAASRMTTRKTSTRKPAAAESAAREPAKAAPPARSGRARSTPARGSAARSIHIDRDGKARVSCPTCQATYRVPEAYLDQRVVCKHCHSGFTPRVVLEKPRRRKEGNPATAPLLKVLLGGIALVAFVIVFNALNPPPKPQAAPVVEKTPTLYTGHPAYVVFEEFTEAIKKRNEQVLGRSIDLGWVHDARMSQGETVWANLDSSARSAFLPALAKELYEDPKWEIFQLYHLFRVKGDVEVPEGTTELTFQCEMQAFNPKWKTIAICEASVAFVDDVWKVRGWESIHCPVKKVYVPKGPEYHPLLGAPIERGVKDVDGNIQMRDYVKPQPLPHLESTPPELRKEIDELIEVVLDVQEDIKKVRKAQRRLIEIEKPAIPRLLTKLYEVKGNTEEERMGVRSVIDCLNQITGQSYGYHPADDAHAGSTADTREAALGFWFGWWTNNWKLEEFHPMDEEEPLPPPGKRGVRRTPEKPKKDN